MPRRPTPPPGEGGHLMVSPQEAATPPVEKKKVDAAFWDKFRSLNKLSPDDRFERLRELDVKYREIDFPLDTIWKNVLIHPEICRMVALQFRWVVEHKTSMIYNKSQTQRLREEGNTEILAHERIAEILEKAGEGVLPSDEDLDAEIISGQRGGLKWALLQWAWQSGVEPIKYPVKDVFRTEGVSDFYKLQLEFIKWLGSMEQDQLREMIWNYHDNYEKKDFTFARAQLSKSFQKWREGQGKEE